MYNNQRPGGWVSILATSLFFAAFLFANPGRSQAQKLEDMILRQQVEAHLRFLASDELKGRKTGEMGNWVAARYIAEQFRRFGLKPGGEKGFYQIIPFGMVIPPAQGTLSLGAQKMDISDDLLVRSAPESDMTGLVKFLPHATTEEITKEVDGKLVITYFGSEEISDPLEALSLTAEKKHQLKANGALGLVEIYNGRHPWNLIKRYLGSGRMEILEGDGEMEFPVLLVNNLSEETLNTLKDDDLEFKFVTDGTEIRKDPSPNVVGVIPGKDPKLKDEYVALTAHFDHVGTFKSQDRPSSEKDSIFNGARDNAFGVTALLSAAETLGKNPPARSVIFIAFTAEEVGLLGSKYYVEHPTVPLEKIIFNLNTDGAGNSDSTIVSVMGLNRVGAAAELNKACEAFGLETFADPAPEQNLFDRSDNVSFAAKGVPAPTFSPGFRQFDNEILKNYHQPSDEVETIDLSYVVKFCKAYAYAARLVADKSSRPKWSTGDKYESAFMELYGDK